MSPVVSINKIKESEEQAAALIKSKKSEADVVLQNAGADSQKLFTGKMNQAKIEAEKKCTGIKNSTESKIKELMSQTESKLSELANKSDNKINEATAFIVKEALK